MLHELVVESRKSMALNACDFVILTEHKSVYTLGRGGNLDNVSFLKNKSDPSHQIYRIERGGDVTWHGPGQFVAYPILDLTHYKKDLRWYVRTLEQTVIDSLSSFGINSERSDINSGVWIDGKDKICAVGIAASRWATMHGIGLNISNDLNYFRNIIPCGISLDGVGVTSLYQEQLKAGITPIASVDDVASIWLENFSRLFGCSLISQKSDLIQEKILGLQLQFEKDADCDSDSILQSMLDSYPNIKSVDPIAL